MAGLMPNPGPKPPDEAPFELFAGPSINAPAPAASNTPKTSAIHLGLGIAAADLQQRLYFFPLPHGHGSFEPTLEVALKLQHSSPDHHHWKGIPHPRQTRFTQPVAPNSTTQ